MMERGLEQLVRECAEAMLEEDIELSEARDFIKQDDETYLPREDGLVIISASRTFAGEDKAGQLPKDDKGKPVRIPHSKRDNWKRHKRLGDILGKSGYAFRLTRGGFVEKNAPLGDGEYNFTVYPYKYDELTHRRIGGILPDMPLEEKKAEFDRFVREMREIARFFIQDSITVVKPKWLDEPRFYMDGQRRNERIGLQPTFRKHRDSIADNNKSFRVARQTIDGDQFYTNERGRTGSQISQRRETRRADRKSPNELPRFLRHSITFDD